MKKTTLRLLSVLLLLTVLTLGSAASARAAESCAPADSVLFEKDGVRVTTAGLDFDPYSDGTDPIIWVEVENTGDRELWLEVSGGSVNGYMCNVYFARYQMEDGFCVSTEQDSRLDLPAGSAERCAIGYTAAPVPGADMKALSELELSFGLAQEPYAVASFRAEPVVIAVGEPAAPVELDSLGTVVLDNDRLKLVIGEQDYESWYGPFIYVYAENKSDHYIGVAGESAEADGIRCDYVLGGLTMAPGKRAASSFQFEGPIQQMKGFEQLTLTLSLYEAADEAGIYSVQERTVLEPVSAQFDPQPWGEYENGGMTLEIQPKYDALLTVATPTDSDILFTVSETASLEAGSHEGAGWLFSIGTVDEDRLHEMLCQDMSGAEVFAKDASGRYYLYYHPTDVRYERATVEQMREDQAQWTMLNQWAGTVRDSFAQKNALEFVSFGNSEVDMRLARAAWMPGEKHTLSTTEFGPVDASAVDGTPYAEYVMRGGFLYTDPAETPDGEYVVLTFPEEDTRLDFFAAPGGYVRVVSGGREELYQTFWYDEERSPADAMREWYYAAAEKAGLKKAG